MATFLSANKAARRLPTYAQKYFAEAIATGQMTEASKQAIFNLIDPFPDTTPEPVGWPDMQATGSLPELIRSTGKITAPASTTTSWNFKVICLPVSNSFSMFPGTLGSGSALNVAAGATTVTYNQWCLWSWKDNETEPSFFTPPTVAWNDTPTTEDTPIRITAQGIEIVNTSAEIARGGMYYAARAAMEMEPVSLPASISNVSAPGANTFRRIYQCSSVPNTLESILNLRTCVQGSAYHGVYAINTPFKSSNELKQRGTTRFVMSNSTTTGSACGVTGDGFHNVHIQDWNCLALYVTGLDPKASFTYNSRTYYELSPIEVSTRTIQSLARANVAYSPLALTILARLCRDLPAGVDYSMNPMGEWFKEMLLKIAEVAPALGRMVPVPGASLLGYGVGSIARGIHHLATSSKAPPTLPKPKHLQARPAAKKTAPPKKK